jgi:hypothetical protein
MSLWVGDVEELTSSFWTLAPSVADHFQSTVTWVCFLHLITYFLFFVVPLHNISHIYKLLHHFIFEHVNQRNQIYCIIIIVIIISDIIELNKR